MDDTWQDENGDWTTKGTLAVPYFLANNYIIIVERNKAVLINFNMRVEDDCSYLATNRQ